MLRKASLADIHALVTLEERSFTSDKLSRRSFRYMLTKAHASLLVETADGMALRGYVLVLYSRGCSMARIYSIAVADPPFGAEPVPAGKHVIYMFGGGCGNGHIQPTGGGVHLGVAVSLRGGGLVAPALHDADRLTVTETMAGMRDLVTRARAGRLRGAELTDPTLTVTNLGEQGVEAVYGVIYPPQVALVGFGRVVERPWAVDGLLGVHPVTTVTLSADHRATDGFTGGRFLAALDELLQHPEEL